MSRIHKMGGGSPPPQPPVNPDFLKQGTDVSCDSCGNYTFTQVFLIKHFSPLVTPNGEEGLLPIPTYACAVCNQINPSLVPPAFRTSAGVTPPAEAPTTPKLVL